MNQDFSSDKLSPVRIAALFNAVTIGNLRKFEKMIKDPLVIHFIQGSHAYTSSNNALLEKAILFSSKEMVSLFLDKKAKVTSSAFRSLLLKGESWAAEQEKCWSLLKQNSKEISNGDLTAELNTQEKYFKYFSACVDESSVKRLISWGLQFDQSGKDGLVDVLVLRGSSDLSFLKFSLDQGFSPSPRLGSMESLCHRQNFEEKMKALELLYKKGLISFINFSNFCQPHCLKSAVAILNWAHNSSPINSSSGPDNNDDVIQKYWFKPLQGGMIQSGDGLSPLEHFLRKMEVGKKELMAGDNLDYFWMIIASLKKDGFRFNQPVSEKLLKRYSQFAINHNQTPPLVSDWVNAELPFIQSIIERHHLNQKLPSHDIQMPRVRL